MREIENNQLAAQLPCSLMPDVLGKLTTTRFFFSLSVKHFIAKQDEKHGVGNFES
jgi:hypothetical protein